MEKIKDMTHVMDEESKTPYAYFDQGGMMQVCTRVGDAMQEYFSYITCLDLLHRFGIV